MKKADEILARVLDEKNRKLAQAYSSVFGTWEQIVGESLAEHSRIYEIEKGYLFIEVDHPGWMQLLLMKKARILRVLKRKFPAMDVKDISVKVNLRYSDAIEAEADSPVEQKENEFTEQGGRQEEIERILSSVSQVELKRRLKRLFLKSLENEKAG